MEKDDIKTEKIPASQVEQTPPKKPEHVEETPVSTVTIDEVKQI